jgi:hypothetical protein
VTGEGEELPNALCIDGRGRRRGVLSFGLSDAGEPECVIGSKSEVKGRKRILLIFAGLEA